MWELLNKLEGKLLKQYTTIDLEEEIKRVYSTYSLNTQIASKTNVERFKGYVQKEYKNLNDYGKFWANKLLKRTKIQNNEIVEFLIYILYNEKDNELDEYENMAIEELVEYTYEAEIEAIKKDMPEDRWKKSKLLNPPLYVLYGMSLLALPNANGYIWKDYKDAMTLYNSNETYRHLLTNGDKDLKDLLLRQKGRYIKKKQNPSKEDTYTGALEDELVYVINQTKLKAYEDTGINKVKFIAVEDKKTTLMCQTLDGQEFWVNKLNVYDRYSAMDDRNVVYRTQGLKVGENLPPINNHYHHCRSTIQYIL